MIAYRRYTVQWGESWRYSLDVEEDSLWAVLEMLECLDKDFIVLDIQGNRLSGAYLGCNFLYKHWKEPPQQA